MDEFDLIQADIYKQELALEDLTDNYYRETKKLEEELNEVDFRRSQLSHLYDEFAEVFYHFSKQGREIDESGQQFTNLLDTYIDITNVEFRKQLTLFEEKEEEARLIYQNKRRQMEDKLEETYDLRRKINLELEDKRREHNRGTYL